MTPETAGLDEEWDLHVSAYATRTLTAALAAQNHYIFRSRLPKLAGVTTVYYGESSEGCECVGKNRVTPYTRSPAGIDKLHRLLGILRSRHIDSTLAAIDCGIGKLGCAIFSLDAVRARKMVLRILQSGILDCDA